jgi:DNA polymerase III subunit alpha
MASASPPFIHLHNHSEYSILDGMCRIRDMVDRAVEFNMPALALTDHGNMFGAVPFYKACQKRGITPIIGCEVYLTPGSRHAKNPDQRTRYHLVLLAKDLTGYHNLSRLVTLAHTEGFYYKPRIDKELLEQYHEGLIALSACLSGEVPKHLDRDDYEGARKAAAWYRDLFGPDDFYLELMDHGLERQRKINRGLVSLAAELDLGLTATNDCHFLDHGDHRAHDVLLCIQTGKTLADSERMRFESDQVYFKSPEEMSELFGELPQALENTWEIARRCHLDLGLNPPGGRLPTYPVPEGESEESYLRASALDGLERRGVGEAAAYRERLDEELGIIGQMGFPGYFLIVWDIVREAREMGVEVGPGRGSAAGSLTAWSLGITDIDPLEYNLLFERFLNPERVSMPDIDLDFADDQRDRVINYVREKYGDDNVAQLITFSKLGARAVIRDVGRVLQVPLETVDKVAKQVPFGPGVTLQGALETTPELKALADDDPLIADVLEYGLKLEGLVRHAGTHAAGVVISDRPLCELVPLYLDNTTQYDGKSVEDVGLLKVDFLGLKNLSVIRDCCGMIRRRHGVEIVPDDIPMGDPKVYELLKACDTAGIFQLESEIARDVLRRVAPNNFRELIPVLSLFRPGPLGSGMTENYIKGKHGEIEVSYPHESLEDVLAETFGVMVYQEQVMQVASRLAGFSYGRADLLRRAMAKKTGELDNYRAEFVRGAEGRGIDPELADGIFEQIVPFASYGFNKSHSAAYAVVTYRTAWLKANYRPEFTAALLSHELDRDEKIAYYIGRSRREGVDVLSPEINRSRCGFHVVDVPVDEESDNGGPATRPAILFGLGAVKNVGLGLVEKLIAERETEGPYASLTDLALRLGTQQVNRRVLESLVAAGAVDEFPGSRAQKTEAVAHILERAAQELRDRDVGQESLFGLGAVDTGPGSVDRLADPLDPNIEPWDEHRRMSEEKAVLGLYLTGHPLNTYGEVIRHFTSHSLGDLQGLRGGEKVRIAGVLTQISRKLDRRGNRIAFVTLEDEGAAVEVAVFSEVYQRHEALIRKDVAILVEGQAQTNREEINVRADAVHALERVPELLARQLHLELPASLIDEDELEPLRELLAAHPGELEIYLHLGLRKGRAVLRAGRGYRVSPDPALKGRLEALLGEGHVHYTPGRDY